MSRPSNHFANNDRNNILWYYHITIIILFSLIVHIVTPVPHHDAEVHSIKTPDFHFSFSTPAPVDHHVVEHGVHHPDGAHHHVHQEHGVPPLPPIPVVTPVPLVPAVHPGPEYGAPPPVVHPVDSGYGAPPPVVVHPIDPEYGVPPVPVVPPYEHLPEAAPDTFYGAPLGAPLDDASLALHPVTPVPSIFDAAPVEPIHHPIVPMPLLPLTLYQYPLPGSKTLETDIL